MKWSKKFGRNRVMGTLETVSESQGKNEDLDLSSVWKPARIWSWTSLTEQQRFTENLTERSDLSFRETTGVLAGGRKAKRTALSLASGCPGLGSHSTLGAPFSFPKFLFLFCKMKMITLSSTIVLL